MDFPDLKQKQASSYLGANWRVVHANREPDLSVIEHIGIRGYLALTLFAVHTYGPIPSKFWNWNWILFKTKI